MKMRIVKITHCYSEREKNMYTKLPLQWFNSICMSEILVLVAAAKPAFSFDTKGLPHFLPISCKYHNQSEDGYWSARLQ